MSFWKRLFSQSIPLTELQVIANMASFMFYVWCRQEGNFTCPQNVFRAQLRRYLDGQSLKELTPDQFDRLLAALRRVANEYPGFLELNANITCEGDLGEVVGRAHVDAFSRGGNGFADLVAAHYRNLSNEDRRRESSVG